MLNIADVTFGIEIECILNDDLLDYGEMPKIARAMFGLSHGWKVKSDGSVRTNADYNGEYRSRYDDSARELPVEIISPPLKGYGGLAEIRRFAEFISKHAYANESCGGHVHIGLDSLYGGNRPNVAQTAEFVQNVTLITAALEDGIFSYSGGLNRMNNDQYAESAKRNTRKLVNEKWNPTQTNRYRACNVAAIGAHGTIEFRLFAGTINPDMWLTNILVALSIAFAARDNKPIPHFLKGLSQKNMESVYRFAFGDKIPKFAARIQPHNDCTTYKPPQRDKKPTRPNRNNLLRQLPGESLEDFRMRYNADRGERDPRWSRGQTFEDLMLVYNNPRSERESYTQYMNRLQDLRERANRR